MSKTRCISASIFAMSVKSGSCQAMTWRVGASRLPSFMRSILIRRQSGEWSEAEAFETPPASFVFLPEGVERLLETAGMRLLGLGQGLEPVGDLLEAFLARGTRHAR